MDYQKQGQRTISRQDIGMPCLAYHSNRIYPAMITRFGQTQQYMLAYIDEQGWVNMTVQEPLYCTIPKEVDFFGREGGLEILAGHGVTALAPNSWIAGLFIKEIRTKAEAFKAAGVSLESYIRN